MNAMSASLKAVGGSTVLRQVESAKHPVGDIQVGQRLAVERVVQRPCDRRAQQRHTREVVEVAGLERRILAIIGEAQEFLGVFGQVGAAHRVDRRHREQGGRGAAPFAAEPRHLALDEIGDVWVENGQEAVRVVFVVPDDALT
jgi:hypothetical protein